ncbi:calmodulin-beta-like [Cucurbita pepo subsp. pepo]|uniref:calmodulin-beta-like n=1 Tax=Cucurbita pepo subsp. pepo TaxID=3664 RepID=UPI000C9D9CAC|nr:calmodulin-beta-like [Cucurbita pepo subsp. pepo]
MCPSGTAASYSDTAPAFRQAFEALDADHDGKISRDDLRKFYSKDADEDAIRSMIAVADLNRNGFVEYEEFERVLSSGRRRSTGIMEEVFKTMDKDGDGRLSHADLKSYMHFAGFSISDEEVEAMIRFGGGDDSDGVSYEGLLKILSVDNVY